MSCRLSTAIVQSVQLNCQFILFFYFKSKGSPFFRPGIDQLTQINNDFHAQKFSVYLIKFEFRFFKVNEFKFNFFKVNYFNF